MNNALDISWEDYCRVINETIDDEQKIRYCDFINEAKSVVQGRNQDALDIITALVNGVVSTRTEDEIFSQEDVDKMSDAAYDTALFMLYVMYNVADTRRVKDLLAED